MSREGWLLTAAGTPYEVGYCIGRALGDRLEKNIVLYTVARTAGREVNSDDLQANALPWLRRLPDRFREELEGMAAGGEVSLDQVASFAYLETHMAAQCSGILVQIEGRVWVARNNDAFGPGLWGHATERSIEGRIPTVTFGLQGDAFAGTGANRERLWLHYHHLPVARRGLQGASALAPHAFLVEALETCVTLQDVEALLATVPRDEGMLLFAVEGKSDKAGIYECAHSSHRRRELTGAHLAATNHAEPGGPDSGDSARSDSLRRRLRLEELVPDLLDARGRLSPPLALRRLLADDAIERRGEDFGTVYANVSCPSLDEHWYTIGGYPAASNGDWQRIPRFG